MSNKNKVTTQPLNYLFKYNKKQKMPLITHHEVASTHLEKIDKLLINFHRLHTQI